MKITPEIAERMNILYLEIGTYSGVAREIGCSASTVKRYIDPNFKVVNDLDIQTYKGSTEIPSPEYLLRFFTTGIKIADLVVIDDFEKAELKSLQESEVSL